MRGWQNVWTNRALRLDKQSVTSGQTERYVWTNRALRLDKQSVTSGQTERYVWTNRTLRLDKQSVTSGQIERYVWTNRALRLDKQSVTSGQTERYASIAGVADSSFGRTVSPPRENDSRGAGRKAPRGVETFHLVVFIVSVSVAVA